MRRGCCAHLLAAAAPSAGPAAPPRPCRAGTRPRRYGRPPTTRGLQAATALPLCRASSQPPRPTGAGRRTRKTTCTSSDMGTHRALCVCTFGGIHGLTHGAAAQQEHGGGGGARQPWRGEARKGHGGGASARRRGSPAYLDNLHRRMPQPIPCPLGPVWAAQDSCRPLAGGGLIPLQGRLSRVPSTHIELEAFGTRRLRVCRLLATMPTALARGLRHGAGLQAWRRGTSAERGERRARREGRPGFAQPPSATVLRAMEGGGSRSGRQRLGRRRRELRCAPGRKKAQRA